MEDEQDFYGQFEEGHNDCSSYLEYELRDWRCYVCCKRYDFPPPDYDAMDKAAEEAEKGKSES